MQYQFDNPNERYLYSNLGTWSSTSDVDTFLTNYNHANNYANGSSKISLGNYVTIKDGTYNVKWMIAGFDMEYNQMADDGIRYSNGYGICMIPLTTATSASWGDVAYTTSGGYISSTMHTTTIPAIITALQNVLGDHIVQRYVLLSNGVNSSTQLASSYTWAKAYGTLMSPGQMNFSFRGYRTRYDDGEANYRMPVFNYRLYNSTTTWTRGIYSNTYTICSNGSYSFTSASMAMSYGVRPVIYIR